MCFADLVTNKYFVINDPSLMEVLPETEFLVFYNNLGNAGFRDEYWSTITAPVVGWYWSSKPLSGSASFGVNFDAGAQGIWINRGDLRIRAFTF